jgi:hypothetical protein
MRWNRLLAALAAASLIMALATNGALAQAAPPGNAPVAKPQPKGLQVTVQAKIKNMKVMGGYYAQGKTEVYGIANQNPEILEPLVKSGETVTIVAQARGDLLIIETLNGKPYQGTPPPAAK